MRVTGAILMKRSLKSPPGNEGIKQRCLQRGLALLGSAVMLALAFAASGCSEWGSATTDGKDAFTSESPATRNEEMKDNDEQHGQSEDSGTAYIEGVFTFGIGGAGSGGQAIDFVFVRSGTYMFVQHRPADARGDLPWSFELYGEREDETVFGDMGREWELLDSRQSPSKGLARGGWINRFYRILKGTPTKHWADILRDLPDDGPITITVERSAEELPGKYHELDFKLLHKATKEAFRKMMERTIDK